MAKTTKDKRGIWRKLPAYGEGFCEHGPLLTKNIPLGESGVVLLDPQVLHDLCDDADRCEKLELLLTTLKAEKDLLEKACDAYEIEVNQLQMAAKLYRQLREGLRKIKRLACYPSQYDAADTKFPRAYKGGKFVYWDDIQELLTKVTKEPSNDQ
jgi:hypothetical protein